MSPTTTGFTRYRTRQYQIEAIQFLGEQNCEEVHAILGIEHPDDNGQCDVIYVAGSAPGVAHVGDWIIRAADGVFDVYTDEEFHDEFEPIPGDEKTNFTWGGGVARGVIDGHITIPLVDGGVLPVARLALTPEQAETIVEMLTAVLADPVGAGSRRQG